MTDDAAKRKGSVLLVDDDTFLLGMYSNKFNLAGYTAQGCLSSDEAIKELQAGASPDAIVFDLIMPGGDGFYLLEQLRSRHLGESAVKVALTNESKDEEKSRATALGASLYLIKASTIPSEVVNLVAAEIEKRHTA